MSRKKDQPFAFRWEWAVRDHGPDDWSPGMKAVLYTLRTWMDNETGYASVSQEDLARGANIKKRQTVGELLNKAEKDGWLTRWKNRGTGQAWAMSHYQAVIPPEVALLVEQKGGPLRGRPSEKGSPISGKRMSVQRYKDVRSGDTNSSYSIDSTSAPSGAGSLAGSPGVSLSGGGRGKDRPTDVPRGQYSPSTWTEFENLNEDDRILIAGWMGRTFSPDSVTVDIYASLSPEQKRELRERHEERNAA